MKLIEEVKNIVISWTPKKKYRTEFKYENEFQEHLYSELNKYRGGFPRKTIPVKQRTDRESCDIVVSNKVGVDFKFIKSSGIDSKKLTRMFSEILKKRAQHKDGVIIVLVGKVTDQIYQRVLKRALKLEELTKTKSKLKSLFEKPYKVIVINKSNN